LIAFGVVSANALGNRLDIYASVPQVLQTVIIILSVSTQFQNENPLFAGINLSLQDIESQVVIAH
jgi:hypothetical protein